MATYLINELLEGKGSHFLDQLNFYILPLANPDGYEYSRYSDRMWRKTRSHNIESLDDSCRGVDGNRNWDSDFYGRLQRFMIIYFCHFWFSFKQKIMQFNVFCSGIYRNTTPCSLTYSGPFPFSEPETRNIRDFVWTLRPPPIVALTLHSYAQYLLYPYGDKVNHYPPNVKEIVSIIKFYQNIFCCLYQDPTRPNQN